MPPEFAVFDGADLNESATFHQEQSPEEVVVEAERELRRQKLWALIRQGLQTFDPSSLRPEHEVRQQSASDWRHLPEEYEAWESDAFLNQAARMIAALKAAEDTKKELPDAA